MLIFLFEAVGATNPGIVNSMEQESVHLGWGAVASACGVLIIFLLGLIFSRQGAVEGRIEGKIDRGLKDVSDQFNKRIDELQVNTNRALDKIASALGSKVDSQTCCMMQAKCAEHIRGSYYEPLKERLTLLEDHKKESWGQQQRVNDDLWKVINHHSHNAEGDVVRKEK